MIHTIKTLSHVKRFIGQQVEDIGKVWHPAVSHADYILSDHPHSKVNERPKYTPKQVAKLDALVSLCHVICEEQGENIYRITLEIIQDKYTQVFIRVKK